MQEIPVQPVAVQSVKFVAGGQNCQILIRQTGRGMMFDLNSNGSDVVTGVIALDAVPLVCRQYEGFAGNFFFIDTQGNSDPYFDGLGSRYKLVYLSAAENEIV